MNTTSAYAATRRIVPLSTANRLAFYEHCDSKHNAKLL
jgi:hypothetical protein